MSVTTQPPRERTAGDTGLPDHLLGLLSSFIGYLQARMELAGIEGKEAAAVYGKVFGLLAVALALVVFGYLFLWIGLVAVVALYTGVNWGWITLGVGLFHLLGTATCALIAKAKWGQPVFTSTLEEFKKDQEWLTSPKQSARRS